MALFVWACLAGGLSCLRMCFRTNPPSMQPTSYVEGCPSTWCLTLSLKSLPACFWRSLGRLTKASQHKYAKILKYIYPPFMQLHCEKDYSENCAGARVVRRHVLDQLCLSRLACSYRFYFLKWAVSEMMECWCSGGYKMSSYAYDPHTSKWFWLDYYPHVMKIIS